MHLIKPLITSLISHMYHVRWNTNHQNIIFKSSLFNQMVNLKILSIRLNVNEFQTIEPIGGKQSQLSTLSIESQSILTVRSGAFQHLVQLKYLNFHNFTTLTFEKEAFKLKNLSTKLSILFARCNLAGKF